MSTLCDGQVSHRLNLEAEEALARVERNITERNLRASLSPEASPGDSQQDEKPLTRGRSYSELIPDKVGYRVVAVG